MHTGSMGEDKKTLRWTYKAQEKDKKKYQFFFPYHLVFDEDIEVILVELYKSSVSILSPFLPLYDKDKDRIKRAVEWLSIQYGYPTNVAKILVQHIINNNSEFSLQEKGQIQAEMRASIVSFFDNAIHQKSQVMVIGLGTAHSSLQMCPPFLSHFIKKSLNVSILNIDPNIYDEESQNCLKDISKPGLNIQCSTIECLNTESLMYSELLNHINNHLTSSSNTPLVISYHINAYIPPLFLEIAKRYPDNMNAGQIMLIHGYHDDQPVVIYSPEYLNSVYLKSTQYGYMGPIERTIFPGITFKTGEELKESIESKTKKDRVCINNQFFTDYTKMENLDIKFNEFKIHDLLEMFSIFIKQGKIDAAKDLVNNNEEILNMKNKFDRTVAHIAVINNNLDDPSIIDFLYKKGIDFTLPDKHNITPMEFVAWNAGPKITKKLFEIQAHKNLSPTQLSQILENANECQRFETAHSIEEKLLNDKNKFKR